MTRFDPHGPENIPCSEGGALHRHVRGSRYCANCGERIIVHARFVRPAELDRAAS